MKYCSTRDKSISIDSALAIKNGLSKDGGLYVPTGFPKISADDMQQLLKSNYIDRARLILGKYLTDFTQEELASCTVGAYTGKFDTKNPTPVVKVGDNSFICELWHGPTCAFKDMALQILPYLLKTSIKKTGEDKTVVILVATSGDTGKAALEGFKDVEGTKIIVFYPNGGVSDIQRLQMVTQEGKNVDVCAIDGNFDNAQTGVKKIFNDSKICDELAQRGYVFSSANSINFGRLAPQIVYYFSSYLDLVNDGEIKLGDKVNFTVPTGNFGNILAAYYAMQMGLPVNKLICASNKNNILTDFINTGVYDKNRDFYLTSSPSMDILVSSNLERLLFEIMDKDDKKVTELMDSLSTKGKYEISKQLMEKLRAVFYGNSIDDDITKEVIAKYYKKDGYVMDTHTAVAVGVYDKYVEQTGDNTKTVIMSTASPFKFCKDVLAALGEHTDITDCRLIDILSQNYNLKAPEQLATLATKPVLFDKVYNKEEIDKVVLSLLK